ncbi:Chaperone protein dnaJ 11 [Morus notabilis]|uniref:Chaperone protein dnaJ 11 n=1 Tax=Morus notabilis TaxID=981085 RepID=W9T0S4_9ROSA|nr:chaperone protein dnaJ 11, chloroplastic [Morus notabilis]EXC35350.1 Chaperone protein dnaJ 11 [Morus notabilis]
MLSSSASFLTAPSLSPRSSPSLSPRPSPSLSPRPSPSPPSPRFGTVRAFAGGAATAEKQEQKKQNQSSTASFLNIDNPSRLMAASLYEILGIPRGATCQEIKAAYRRLARVCHPDVAAIDRKDSSADDFKKIHAAYSTLSDPAKRADYDRKLLRRHGRPLTVATGFSGFTRRNWETDQCW